MAENRFQLIYKGKVEKEISIPLQDIDRKISEEQKESNIVRVNEEGTTLMQVKHEFISVGETIAQIKYNTAATVTERGTIVVSQFKQEISSRGEEVWYYKNSHGTFEGTLAEAKIAFPDVDFEGIKQPETQYVDNPEFGQMPIIPNSQPLQWETINEYDGEKEGGPTTWDKWADATQTALDVVGLIPGVGEIADCINGVISLSRGNYADAALSFAAMIPFAGTAATVTKQARKLKKLAKANKEATEGVYDLIVKNGDDVENYIGKSKNVFQRFIQHFKPKRGKLATKTLDKGSIIHKMDGATDYQMEMVENWLIIKKYKFDWQDLKNSGVLKKLLNKRNPVGGRHNLKTPDGVNKFMKEAEEIIDSFEKYGLRESLEKSLKNSDNIKL